MSPSRKNFLNVTGAVCALMAAFAGMVFVVPSIGSQPKPTPRLAAQLKILPHVTITVLADNLVADTRVLGEWGLAMLVDTGQRRVLFDTGGGRVLAGNAQALHVDLSTVDAIVISHGHDDHAGGLARALDATGKTDVFVHPAAFGTTYWKEEGRAVPYGMSVPREQLATRARRIVETEEPTLVTDGIMVTGGIPRVTDFEDTGITGEAFRDAAMKTPDSVPDDQALFFRTPEGMVILFGCGHAGVVNTIRYVSGLLGENRIFAVVGGTHLLTASPRRMQETEEAFRQYGLQKIMLSHCTGVAAFSRLAATFPGRCSWPAAGSVIEFGK
jgi:7,8-dihydropterin-6-yl-methyl-4-(beta-D-ribofuranosyl)aminobenzene 5'-phosphate synthase